MIGKILDRRYEIISKIGEGAFGHTYLAIDRKLPDKDQCVVKHFSPKATDPNTLYHARRLFETEAKVLNRLGSHNRIPRLLAHFEEETNFYLVEEFIAGHDLSREIIPNHLWSQDKVISFLQDILETLNFVHQHNVIHRDIKPSNLIRHEQHGTIFLIDFGAVKQISSQSVNSHGEMTSTVVIGTLGYMPSEQSQGQPRLCSDIYAVGVIAIQALTGLPATQLIKDSQTGEIVWRNKVQVNQQLADILDKMIKYDFRQRYQSASEVLQDLQTIKIAKHQVKSGWWKAVIILGIASVMTAILLMSIMLTSGNNYAVYDNEVYGIKIKYPQNWLKSGNSSGIPDRITGNLVKFRPAPTDNSDRSPENINLIIQDLPENTDLEAFTQSYINSLNTNLLEKNKTQLANQPAYQVSYLRQEEGKSIQTLQIWLVKNHRAYIITYSAEASEYSKHISTAKTMINSFQLN